MSSWARLDEKARRGEARFLAQRTAPISESETIARVLTPRQSEILHARYGLYLPQGKTIDEIAARLQITPSRVTQALVLGLWRIADLP